MDRKTVSTTVKYVLGIVFFALLVWGVIRLLYPSIPSLSNLQWEQKEADFWQFQRNERRFWYEDAEQYCRQLTLDKHYDWRLPTVAELQALTKLTVGRRRSLARVERAIYWTAIPADNAGHRYFAFSFLTGKSAPMAKHNYNSVVCVRNVSGATSH
ncbi:MAG: DUF1566 domain-containing protein [Desulfuromonas sp.]|nr:DUF1566 domain-containing protein [Desulfuromonas sp.]